jgi:hypothetical protein
MFEKEAEEYIKKDGTETENMLNNITLSLTSRQAFILKNAFKQTFKDGAEFGYNKANEWHYVKDGYLPPEDTKVFALMANKGVCIAHFYRRNVWDKIGTVIAWKEIVLPELKEIE